MAGAAAPSAGEGVGAAGAVFFAVGSAAAIGSFVSFSVGAAVPLIPYLLLSGGVAFAWSFVASLMALLLLGLGISRLTRRAPLPTAVRQVLLGGIAALVTYGVGSLIGIQV